MQHLKRIFDFELVARILNLVTGTINTLQNEKDYLYITGPSALTLLM